MKWLFLACAFWVVAGASDAHAEEPTPPRWCAPELEQLEHEVCFFAPAAKQGAPSGPKTLVIFLHSLVNRGTSWQWEQQRTMKQVAERHGFSVLMPRGRLGVGPGGAPDVWAWPTAQRTEGEVESELVAEWTAARSAVEARLGPFERLWVFGFSSGAYYAASLALRDRVPATGYGLFAGGSGSRWKATRAKSVAHPAPIFVAYGTKDPARREQKALARLLDKLGWPHRLDAAPVGHTVTNEQLRRAFEYLASPASPARPRASR